MDLTLAGTRPDVMAAALEVLTSDPRSDLVIAVAGSSARFQPHLLVPPIVAAAEGAKPLVAFVTPDAPEALDALAAAGVPSFRTPEACADAIAASLRRHPPKPLPSLIAAGAERQLDEAESYARLAELGIDAAAHRVVAPSAPASPLGYPVAVKLLSETVAHKTELGGVVLNIADDHAFRAAAHRLGALAPRLLVQSMVTGVGEVLVGFHRDADAGPIILLAAGGVTADLLKDRSIRLAPVAIDEAHAMIAEVRSLTALSGYRGRPRGDLNALAETIVALSHAGEEIVAAEINPLVVLVDGVAAVDAVVRVSVAA